jgi:HK97 family phage major capsid protein
MDLLQQLEARRSELFEELDAIAKRGAAAGDFTPEDAERFEEARKDLDTVDVKIAALKDIEAKRASAAQTAAQIGTTTVQVVSEPEPYNPQTAREGVSFFRDVMTRGSDPNAAERLARHHRVHAEQTRDVGTGAFAGLTVPQYLTDLVAPVRRAGRPLADIANGHPLPASGMTVNISRITTGAAVATQATENSDTQETNMDDTLLTIDVRTIAGKQDVSRQAIERSEGVDSIVIQDLTLAYDAELDRQLIHADGTSGTHLGLLSTTGNIDVTYTDATPTVAELYPKFADAVQQVQAATFMGVSHFVMHPRRYWWMAKEVGTSFPFFQPVNLAQGTGGQVAGTGYGQVHVGPLGIPVVLDGNIATNLGGGTEDVVLAVTASELHLWEDGTLLLRTEDALSNQLSVRFVLYGYSAFTAGRYPNSQANITGTGLAAPTF